MSTSQRLAEKMASMASQQQGRIVMNSPFPVQIGLICRWEEETGETYDGFPPVRIVAVATKEDAELQSQRGGWKPDPDSRYFYWAEACD